MAVTPYKETDKSKKEQVATMFNNIARRYDFLNHFLSLGIDILWRKKAIKLLKKDKPKLILDIATGTADFAIEALSLNPDKITGIDISKGMLDVGRIKLQQRKLDHKIELIQADSENLPFSEHSFDAIIAAFGVRNFENLEKGISNMHRVLKKDGKVIILEFSKPRMFPVKQIYNFYFNNLLPYFGKLISKDVAAYSYLPESVNAFPDGQDFLDVLNAQGFKETVCYPLLFGIASIYSGRK